MKSIPYLFQRQGVRQMTAWGGRALLAGDMGTGKSIMSGMVAERLDAFPILVVCFASLKLNWEREFNVHFGWSCEVLSKMRPPRGWQARAKVLIINYDVISGAWLTELGKIDIKMIIIDESQAIVNQRTKRYKQVKRLIRGRFPLNNRKDCTQFAPPIPHVLALSGTPFLNRVAELWPVLNLVRPDLYPSFWNYAQNHCSPKKNRFGHWEFNGSENLGTLHKNLTSTMMVRFRKEDVLRDLPNKQWFVVPLELSEEGRKEYDHAKNDFLGWVRKHDVARLGSAERAEQLSRLNKLRMLAGVHKIPAVIGWIDSFLASEPGKLCMFGIHRETIRLLVERYHRTCASVHGGVKNAERQGEFDRFVRDDRCRLFFGNKAASTGWSAKGVHNVGLFEFPWTSADVEQMVARCHGIGRGKMGEVTNCWSLVAKDTVEQTLLRIISGKQGVLADTLDGSRKGARMNVHEQLVKLMLKENER
jgi:SWI/SNF-related matrix-associated actin-dependent regulator of chromatin subfamily A-like protein 1